MGIRRLRPLTTGQATRLEGLRRLAQLLDSAFTVPGTTYRVGLDPIIGLVPGIGDLISPLFTIGILWQAYDLGVPKVAQVRMLFNVAVDACVGVIPLAGDLFDFAWKANVRNLALLERHAEQEHRATLADWCVAASLTIVVVALAAIPFVIAGWLLTAVGRRLF